jgi:hypothetical protein
VTQADSGVNREGRRCAREGCGELLSRRAGTTTKYCSAACRKAASPAVERPSVKHRELTENEPRSIYDAGERAGHILVRPYGVLAFDRRQNLIGQFDAPFAATEAVLRRARAES